MATRWTTLTPKRFYSLRTNLRARHLLTSYVTVNLPTPNTKQPVKIHRQQIIATGCSRHCSSLNFLKLRTHTAWSKVPSMTCKTKTRAVLYMLTDYRSGTTPWISGVLTWRQIIFSRKTCTILAACYSRPRAATATPAVSARIALRQVLTRTRHWMPCISRPEKTTRMSPHGYQYTAASTKTNFYQSSIKSSGPFPSNHSRYLTRRVCRTISTWT